jgi:F-type H+-transporting ATPase subunit delta
MAEIATIARPYAEALFKASRADLQAADAWLQPLAQVASNAQLQALPEIAAQFRALKNAQSGSSDALVQSAFPIEGAALADVSALLEKRFGRKLNVKVQLAPELIGGIRVVVGDEVLDTSVQSRLEQMKTALLA